MITFVDPLRGEACRLALEELTHLESRTSVRLSFRATALR
jgi:hypothetical protein